MADLFPVTDQRFVLGSIEEARSAALTVAERSGSADSARPVLEALGLITRLKGDPDAQPEIPTQRSGRRALPGVIASHAKSPGMGNL